MSSENPTTDLQAATQKAMAVKQAYEQMLLSKPNVVGVGVGFRQVGGQATDTVSVVVLVKQKLPDAQLAPDERIPVQIEDVPIDVQEVGEITAF
jgi:hypothetical protein